MRFAFFTLALASLVTAAAYSTDKVLDHMAYANSVSHGFARGDNGDASGWRECSEAEDDGHFVGVVCDGTRVIQIHSGELVDVNYFCEFQFLRAPNGVLKVKYALCQ